MIDYVVYGLPCLLAPYLLGWGLTALLLPDRLRGYEAWFAPWIGMVQTALVLMAFGFFGTGVRRSWPAAVLVAVLPPSCWLRRRREAGSEPAEAHGSFFRPLDWSL